MAMRAHSPVAEAALGGWRYLDFYSMSEGARSFDGVHYSLQVRLGRLSVSLSSCSSSEAEQADLLSCRRVAGQPREGAPPPQRAGHALGRDCRVGRACRSAGVDTTRSVTLAAL